MNLKSAILNILKITIPLAFGIFLIWYIYESLSQDDKDNVWESFKNAHLSWLVLSVALGIISHASRSYRWCFMLEPMGYKPRFLNSFFSVMIGYLANLAFPRLGEVSRCAIMSKYEKISFEKLIGTVIAERAADLIILFTLTAIAIFSQLFILKNFLSDISTPIAAKFNTTSIIIIFTILVFAATAVFLMFKNAHKYQIAGKIKAFIQGIFEGIKTIKTMKKKWAFIFHSLFIWAIYFAMFYACFFSIEQTKNVSLSGVLAAFVFGSYGVIAVQGGIGAYPAIIMQTLVLYSVPKAYGFALGWICWTSQTIMIIAVGFCSMAAIPLYNKQNKIEDKETGLSD